jgi:hypothetical protein
MDDEIIHIREPFFTAGRQFKWLGEYKRTIGIGIRLAFILMDDGILRVRVADNPKTWRISKVKAREIYAKYNTKHTTNDGTVLAVLPWEAFDEERRLQ